MFIRFYHVNSFYQLMKGYLGRELQDMEKVVVYTTGRYLTEFAAKTGFNSAENIQSKQIKHKIMVSDQRKG